MELQRLLVTTIALVCVGLLKGQGFKPAGQISEQCLDCICEASSGCGDDIGCFPGGSKNEYTCGPYVISYHYWIDGGRPGANGDDPLDFEKCLNVKACAEATIKGYMQRWGHDCNGDGYIDCYDWALLHKAGPYKCNGTWVQNNDYWTIFKTCYSNENL